MARIFLTILVFCLAIGIFTPQNARAEITPPPANIAVDQEILDEINADGSASFWVNFRSGVDLTGATKLDWVSRGRSVHEKLKQKASDSQAKFIRFLEKSNIPYQSFWIKNTVLVENADMNILDAAQSFAEVESVTARKTYFLFEADTTKAVTDNFLNAVEPNLTHINADDVWALGINGSGMVVANIDTGVRFTHQSLVNQYRGNNNGTFNHNYNWYNPENLNDNFPSDGHGHGTHTMGTMVGADGAFNQIGVAPGAKWIACSGCPNGVCSDIALLVCGQWIAAPTDLTGANPNPDMRPNVVNNSWGDCGQSYDGWYEVVIANWHAAGIYPIFSNGNNSGCGFSTPPGLNTVGNPARYGNVTGVGSSGEQNGLYATHSNWGPTDNLDTVNATAFADLKPQVIAPGVSIRSSTPASDTEYQDGWSGTSMSAPHVAGLVALIWQAAPCLVGDYARTETIIEVSATDIIYEDGSANTLTNFPNYATGWGEIDALAAVTQASELCSKPIIYFLPLIIN